MKKLTLIIASFIAINGSAQVSRLGQDIEYMGEISTTLSDGDIAPFWISSNRYGLNSTEANSGYLRGSLFRATSADEGREWKVGYGADLVVPVNHTSSFFIHQLYGELEYNIFRLTAGAKEMPLEFTNGKLSLGDMTLGNNARPIPQIRLDMTDFWTVPGCDEWLGLKAMLSYGWFTDNNWQEDFTNKQSMYSANSLYHNKALYIRVGNEERFPLTFTGGLEFSTQFGGEAWNVAKRLDDQSEFDNSHIKLNNGIKGYWNAFFMGGSDANDGDYKNAEGNHLGSWQGSLKYKGKDWSVKGYFEHYFEDHSQLFFEYGWKDMLWGIEAELPDNPIVSNAVVEYISTKDQTGGLYHDATTALPIQISGQDNYYSHHVYGAWQHWGQNIGIPLLISPIYNNGRITCLHSRIRATHVGLMGNPINNLHYRLLYTHMKSWGTYILPLVNPEKDSFLLTEITYDSHKFKGWSLTGSIGVNSGKVISNSTGFSLTLRKKGVLR